MGMAVHLPEDGGTEPDRQPTQDGCRAVQIPQVALQAYGLMVLQCLLAIRGDGASTGSRSQASATSARRGQSVASNWTRPARALLMPTASVEMVLRCRPYPWQKHGAVNGDDNETAHRIATRNSMP